MSEEKNDSKTQEPGDANVTDVAAINEEIPPLSLRETILHTLLDDVSGTNDEEKDESVDVDLMELEDNSVAVEHVDLTQDKDPLEEAPVKVYAYMVDFGDDMMLAGEQVLDLDAGKDHVVFKKDYLPVKECEDTVELKFELEVVGDELMLLELDADGNITKVKHEGELTRRSSRKTIREDFFWSRNAELCDAVLLAFRLGKVFFRMFSPVVQVFPVFAELRRDLQMVQIASQEAIIYRMLKPDCSEADAEEIRKMAKLSFEQADESNAELMLRCTDFSMIEGGSIDLWRIIFHRGFLSAAYRHLDNVLSLVDAFDDE